MPKNFYVVYTNSIVLGKPTGGFALDEDASECKVTIVNDVRKGEISFDKDQIIVDQSSEKIVIPVHRTINNKSNYNKHIENCNCI